MRNKWLEKAAKDLKCSFKENDSLDVSKLSAHELATWLFDNRFAESRVRVGRYFKGGCMLQYDDISLTLYEPRL